MPKAAPGPLPAKTTDVLPPGLWRATIRLPLQVRLRFLSGTLIPWEFERADELFVVDSTAHLIIGVEAVPSSIELAVKTPGIILTPENWLDPYIRDGVLEPVLADWWPKFEGPCF